jgi:hypothetical protein
VIDTPDKPAPKIVPIVDRFRGEVTSNFQVDRRRDLPRSRRPLA